VAGDYVYFGIVGQTLPLATVIIVAPVAGVLGGATGGLFSRLTLWFARGGARRISGGRPLLLAAVCGLIVAVLGIATGTTWGTGYAPARAMIQGTDTSIWFGAAKFASTLVTTGAGLPGGIFSPSLATGAGVGNVLHVLFPREPAGAVILLGMVAYFTGVVRAPLTAVIIISETTGSRGLMLPLLAAAIIAEGVAALVCRERLYHGLATGFLPKESGT
jgi:H+/Cl- antiporter ClcA